MSSLTLRHHISESPEPEGCLLRWGSCSTNTAFPCLTFRSLFSMLMDEPYGSEVHEQCYLIFGFWQGTGSPVRRGKHLSVDELVACWESNQFIAITIYRATSTATLTGFASFICWLHCHDLPLDAIDCCNPLPSFDGSIS